MMHGWCREAFLVPNIQEQVKNGFEWSNYAIYEMPSTAPLCTHMNTDNAGTAMLAHLGAWVQCKYREEHCKAIWAGHTF